MRDHGAHAIVPVNIVMMVGCVVVSLVVMPWWVTVLVTLLMVAIRNLARDPYGGMQFCVLLLPGLFMAMLGTAQILDKARQDGLSPVVGKIVLMAVIAPIGFALSFLALMAIVVAAAIAWEWLRERSVAWRIRKP
jgi:hypothetical protein